MGPKPRAIFGAAERSEPGSGDQTKDVQKKISAERDKIHSKKEFTHPILRRFLLTLEHTNIARWKETGNCVSTVSSRVYTHAYKMVYKQNIQLITDTMH